MLATISKIKTVHDLCSRLIQHGYNVILVLDIDDTVLCTRSDCRDMVEPAVAHLIRTVYANNPNHVIFLTARQPCTRELTLQQLNEAPLLDDVPRRAAAHHHYQVVFSPPLFERKLVSTKGQALMRCVHPIMAHLKMTTPNKPTWVCFVDDQLDNIRSVQEWIPQLDCNYTLFHYIHTQLRASEQNARS